MRENNIDEFVIKLTESSIEFCQNIIEGYKKQIKSCKELIKINKEIIREGLLRNTPVWFIDFTNDSIRRDKDRINECKASLKEQEACLVKLQIEKFVESKKKFTVIKGGIS